jgi:hypothetical protein
MKLSIDELYLARMDAESAEQVAWEQLRRDRSDLTLVIRHREAEKTARQVEAAYLDALVQEQARLVAV